MYKKKIRGKLESLARSSAGLFLSANALLEFSCIEAGGSNKSGHGTLRNSPSLLSVPGYDREYSKISQTSHTAEGKPSRQVTKWRRKVFDIVCCLAWLHIILSSVLCVKTFQGSVAAETCAIDPRGMTTKKERNSKTQCTIAIIEGSGRWRSNSR